MKQLEFDFEELRVNTLEDVLAISPSSERMRINIGDLLRIAEQYYIRNEHQIVTGIHGEKHVELIQQLLIGRMVDSISKNLRQRYLLLVAYLAQFKQPRT